MRTRTFILSFLVHAAMLGAVMVVRMFAATELPDPPRSTSFMMAAAEVPEVQQPPAARTQATTTSVDRDAAPIEEPDSLAPESHDLADIAPVEGAIVGEPGNFTSNFFGDRPAAPPAPPIVPSPPPQPLHVGGVVRPPQKVHHVAPVYPPIAQAARVSGTVIVEALIAEDGSVRDVKVLRSVALLDAPAVEAVRQWRFTPTLLNGVPVQVIMSVTVTFTLN